MPYTAITKPLQGDPTRKPLVDALIDNDAHFQAIISSLGGGTVPNGSFELFTNTGGADYPDAWDRNLYTGGSFAMTGTGRADTTCQHGRCAVKFTHPGGSGNGGGYLTSSDFLEVSALRPTQVSWLLQCTDSRLRVKAQVLFFDGTFTAISTSDIYNIGGGTGNNPSSWQRVNGWFVPPTTARFAKLRFICAENTGTIAGSVYLDDVRVAERHWMPPILFSVPGSYLWTPPVGVQSVAVLVVGAGGNGGTAGNNGWGGAAGGAAFGTVSVANVQSYVIKVGAPGGGATNGASYMSSDSGIVIQATGGTNAGSNGGGTPGTGTGGVVNLTGTAGTGPGGGVGGYIPAFGFRCDTATGSSPGTGRDGNDAGWGVGGGGGVSAQLGGAGSAGRVVLWLA